MAKKTVALLFGGKSSEHEVSVMSAASVLNHLNTDKWTPLLLPIGKDGTWRFLPRTVTRDIQEGKRELNIYPEEGLDVQAIPGKGLAVRGEVIPMDIAFPVLHGNMGEDGTVQGLLELCGIPYIGSGVLGSALGMDKEKSKELWIRKELPVVPFISVKKPATPTAAEKLYTETWRAAAEKFSLPLFVKPATYGSSVGVRRVDRKEEFQPALDTAFALDSKILIEPAMAGKEVECSVLGNEEPRAFPPGEIRPSHDFYDYEAKYIDPKGAELIIPADIPKTLAEKVMSVAVKAFLSIEAKGFSRVDFFVDVERKEVFLNEINTLPGFTKISMFPRMCEAGGLPYSAILDELITLGLGRYQ